MLRNKKKSINKEIEANTISSESQVEYFKGLYSAEENRKKERNDDFSTICYDLDDMGIALEEL